MVHAGRLERPIRRRPPQPLATRSPAGTTGLAGHGLLPHVVYGVYQLGLLDDARPGLRSPLARCARAASVEPVTQLSDGWFFLRYADPDPHLHVRFHTYEREVERYGGTDGMRVAEAVFTADSPAVAGILLLNRQDRLSSDLMTVAVLSIDDLLAGIGLDAEQRTAVYRDAAARSGHDGGEYRRRQRTLRQLLGRPEALTESPEGQVLAALLTTRRAALAPTAALLSALERKGRLHRPRTHLARSYIHLHVNRLLGSDPSQERLALQLLRRTREALNRRQPRQHGSSIAGDLDLSLCRAAHSWASNQPQMVGHAPSRPLRRESSFSMPTPTSGHDQLTPWLREQDQGCPVPAVHHPSSSRYGPVRSLLPSGRPAIPTSAAAQAANPAPAAYAWSAGAPPARIELTTHGLGNRCSVH